MYANTPTRMKASAVVHGLKSLASKLHPQLPLSAKESQRLLTALTSSFRKQLDQAHPVPSGDEITWKLPGNNGLSKAGTKQLHSSSATFADRHLASVLTNPLLSKADKTSRPSLNIESAKLELKQDPDKDPISLLEEYQEKGTATVPIALLCLGELDSKLMLLPEEQRKAAIHKTNAGKRTLLWLWSSKMYETDDFVDNTAFMHLLCLFLLREQSEHYFWDWWKIDMTGGSRSASIGTHLSTKERFLPYRWKGRILRNFVSAKLTESKHMYPNSALDAFLQACSLKESAIMQGTSGSAYPLGTAALELELYFKRHRQFRKNVDPHRYDSLLRAMPIVWDIDDGAGRPEKSIRQVAELWLFHPVNPSGSPALRMLRRLFEFQSADEAHSVGLRGMWLRQFTSRDEKTKLNVYHMMVRTAVLLQERANTKDSEWVLSKIKSTYPHLEQYLEMNMKNERLIYGFELPHNSTTANHDGQSAEIQDYSKAVISPF